MCIRDSCTAARADALEAKLEEVLAAVQQTGARSAQDIGKALQPVAASVAALQKRVEAVEKRPRPAGAPPPRAPPAPIEHEEADASDLSQADPRDDDSVTPGAASRPTFGLPEPATFGLPGSPGNQAATFGLPSMGLAPKLGPLPTTVVEEKKPTAPPAEEVAAQVLHEARAPEPHERARRRGVQDGVRAVPAGSASRRGI